ncbi:PKD domain-containing protein [Exilibacterium tricleocarpae]|uniref:PKD domain-containing protein n=1 Tax=Exilibacterium tricleocarpae TaxID=2591008 RepID=A0A545SSU8_9GAMM|nr:cellulose binding domain-containing protein [Exilibacterium tricleocarpae]TQV68044.1 PKD domain-containing protein [Exilibacterium tricleocarpae]
MDKSQCCRWLVAGAVIMSAVCARAQDGSDGPGIDNRARPAGTYLKFVPLGGRMVQFHRGYLYIMGQGKTTLWDVSDATDPTLLTSRDYGDNGHRWWKLNTDIFWREYSTPEVTGSGYHFLDLRDMFDLKPWTDPQVPVPIAAGGQGLQKWQLLETFPTGTNGGNVHDLRYDDPALDPDAITATFPTGNGAEGSLRFRIGNLLFTTTGSGIAVLDIGDPKQVNFLDSVTGPGFQQYTTTYHVWRDRVVFLNGNDGNLNDNNLAMIDFSDPTDLKAGVWPGGSTGLKVAEMSAGRYMYFQDQYGFTGQNDLAVKIDMETGEIVQRFVAPGWPETYLDYQWMPLGPVVVGSGSNGGDGRTFFYQHQDGPDSRGPEIGFHSPFANSINNPVSTVIGFSIPEIIDERTANDRSIQIRPIGGGEPIEGDITWNSYHVLNFIPKVFLQPDTTYEVKFVEGGLKDVAGNGIGEYVFYFSTGAELNVNAPPVVDAITYGGEAPLVAGEPVVLTALASDPEGDSLEYRWDFGAGNSAWSSANTVTHTFAAAGLPRINVQVRDAQGGISGAGRNLVVVMNSTASAATHSGPLALDAAAGRLAVVNPDNDSLALIDADTLEKVAEYAVCKDPVSVTVAVAGQAWVACRDADQIQVLALADGTTLALLDMSYGAKPYGVIANPVADTVYVSLSGSGEVRAFDAQSFALLDTLALGQEARAMAVSPDGGTLLVTRFISVGDSGEVWEVDLQSFSLTGVITLADDTVTPDTGSGGSGLPNYLAGVAIDPSGTRAISVGKKDNVDRGLFLGTDPLTFESTVRSLLAPISLTDGREQFAARIDIDNHAQPSAVTYSPLGSHLFVTLQGNNRLIALNPADGTEVVRVDTGLAPQGVLVDPSTQRVFVKNFMGRSVSVFDATAMLNGGSAQLPLLATVATVAAEKLTAQVLAGKRVFYNAADPRMALEGYISCAVCHDDGDQDGRVWDFTDRGEGLRNTIALRGRAGTGHGRVHWSANFDEIQDFEHDIRGPFGGRGFLSDADFAAAGEPLGVAKAGRSPELDALAAYLDSLDTFDKSPYRRADGGLTDTAQAGKQVFIDAGCGNCHGGSAFSDSGQGLRHDVGTLSPASGARLGEPLRGLDTPTLRDLWATAPYLHDGSAATLEALLATAGGHGFDSLTPLQRVSLAAYLRQIDGTEAAPAEPGFKLTLSSVQAGQITVGEAVPLAVDTNIAALEQVVYYANGDPVATGAGVSFETTWTPPGPGSYRLQARAVYNNGNTATLSAETVIQFGGSGACEVSYTLAGVWGSGYQADIVVTNTSAEPVAGYDLQWSLGAGEQFAAGWNATFSSAGVQVTASNAAGAWNGTLAPGGGTSSVGFRVDKRIDADAHQPAVFTLNGTVCTRTN